MYKKTLIRGSAVSRNWKWVGVINEFFFLKNLNFRWYKAKKNLAGEGLSPSSPVLVSPLVRSMEAAAAMAQYIILLDTLMDTNTSFSWIFLNFATQSYIV